MFEKATRQKLQFFTSRGALQVQDVWDMPITSKNGFNLDELYKSIKKDMKDTSEEGLVSTSVVNEDDQLRLEIITHIFNVKTAEAAAKASAKEKAEKRSVLLDLIAQKDADELAGKSKEELLKELEALSE